MLHAAPTSETKADTGQSKSQVVPQPERELHPHVLSTTGRYSSSGMSAIASGASPNAQRRQALAGRQSTQGNQAVLRMLHSPQQAACMTTLRPSQGIMLQRKCACGGTPESEGECAECKTKREGALQSQAKLTISQSGDMYEREADRVAEEVMGLGIDNAGLSQLQSISRSAIKPPVLVQRQDDKSVDDEQEESVEHDEDSGSNDVDLTGDEEEDEIVADETGMPKLESGVPPSQASSIPIPAGVGRPLDPDARLFMEQRIGHDFSHVRIHTDPQAISSARQLRAHAYTVGSDIYFNANRYNPSNAEGLKLLAHELTHVVQQTGHHPAKPQVQRKTSSAKKKVSERKTSSAKKKKKVSDCSGKCAAAKAPVHLTGCQVGTPPDQNNFLRHLEVSRAGHTVDVAWGPDKRKLPATKTDQWPCSPSTKSGPHGKIPTPLGPDKVGLKCDSCHTNKNGDGMAWFTGLAKQYLAVGFHNSQHVGSGFESHGCIRVSCEHAKRINQETWSGHTTIKVNK